MESPAASHSQSLHLPFLHLAASLLSRQVFCSICPVSLSSLQLFCPSFCSVSIPTCVYRYSYHFFAQSLKKYTRHRAALVAASWYLPGLTDLFYCFWVYLNFGGTTPIPEVGFLIPDSSSSRRWAASCHSSV